MTLFLAPGASDFCPKTGITAINRLPPPSTRRLSLPGASSITPLTGTGLLTRCPSPTLPSLGLGPTNPTRTDLPSEPFDVRRQWFSHCFRYSCQHSHSCTLQHLLPRCLLRLQNAPLPNAALLLQVPGFGGVFSPVTFSAQPRLTSELLRTL